MSLPVSIQSLFHHRGFAVHSVGSRGYLRPVLEPLPMWRSLKDLLSGIQQEIWCASDDSERSILVVGKEMSSKDRLKLAIQGNV